MDEGEKTYRLRPASIENLTEDLLCIRQFIPVENNRRPRSIKEVERWKATEFRLFLLYVGPIIMQIYLGAEYAHHFCTLHIAIRILCHRKDCIRNNSYAAELLAYFVKNMRTLYGNENMVYNVHNLLHLTDDVKRYGSLDTFSAFPFENHMRVIKKLIRKAENPLAQLHNRISERSCANITNNMQSKKCESADIPLLVRPDNKRLPQNCIKSHKQMNFKNFVLKTDYANNVCYLKDGSVFSIKHIGYKNNVAVVLGKKYCLEPSPIYPFDSGHMKIFIGKKENNIQLIPGTDIHVKDVKAFRIIVDDVHYIMPILHL